MRRLGALEDAGRLWAAEIYRQALDLLFPPRCAACGGAEVELWKRPFCPACLDAFIAIHSPWCPVCGQPWEDDEAPDAVCPGCQDEPPPFDLARSALAYGGPAADAFCTVNIRSRG